MAASKLAATIGIVGGSGLYDIPDIELDSKVKIDTPFGDPSDEYVLGHLRGVKVAFLARHGPGHRITAPGVNFRANVYGFKALGVETLISFSACGSMREDLHPTDIIIPDQIIDITRNRQSTFFDEHPAIHVGMGDPVCPTLSKVLYESALEVGADVRLGGTYICMQGPAFSTRAESNLYRSWGVDVIGMTAATEAKLCREAEICYSTIALVTDYDVWKEEEEDVTLDMIIGYVLKNADTGKLILKEAISKIPDLRECDCRRALVPAIATNPDFVSEETRAHLRVLLEKYLPPKE
jgi:5'-methylthioadenosine phosphorylase